MKKVLTLLTCLLFTGMLFAQSIVEHHGRLVAAHDGSINFKGSKSGEVAYPAGASLFWSSAASNYYNAACVKNLKEQYNVQVVRSAMTAFSSWSDGYVSNPGKYQAHTESIVNAAVAEGIYVIIDWHCEGDASWTVSQAKTFFGAMAQKYGHLDNVIYEVWNEPTHQTWNATIKPYCEQVISEIRKYDPDNLVLCGTQTWSQLVQDAAANPINDNNVGYVLHFYSDLHDGGLYNGKENLGVPIFVTEWGTPGYHHNTDGFVNWMKANKVPNCSWAVNNKDEALNYFQPWVNNPTGPWADGDLRDAGKVLTAVTKTWPGNVVAPPPPPCVTQHIPNTIEAENYCAQSGIKTEPCVEGGKNVGYISDGDWLSYRIFLETPGEFKVEYRVASLAGGGQIRMEQNAGSKILGTVDVPKTNGWQNWITVSHNITLSAGEHVIGLSFPKGGFNINWVKFSAVTSCTDNVLATIEVTAPKTSITIGESIKLGVIGRSSCKVINIDATCAWSGNAPGGVFTGTTPGDFQVAASLNGIVGTITIHVGDVFNGKVFVVQAEDFTYMSGIQTENCNEGGQNVGYIDAGDWMSYEYVNVPSTGTYEVEFRVASAVGGGKFNLDKDAGAHVLATVEVPNTGGWQNWQTIKKTVSLDAGINKLGIGAIAGGFNINYMKFTQISATKKALVSNEETIKLSVYPNPVTSSLTVNGLNNDCTDLLIYSVDGRVQKALKVDNTQNVEMDVTTLENGLYIMRVVNTNGTSNILKFIKR